MHDDRHVQTLGRAARQEVAARRGAAHAGHDDEPRARKRRGGHGTELGRRAALDRESTRLNSSHLVISYAVFCLKKKKKTHLTTQAQLESLMLHLHSARV